MRPLYITCSFGLCNRLGFMFSCLFYARKVGRTVVMGWPLNTECPASFDRYFEPVKDLSITTHVPGVIDIEWWHPHPDLAGTYLFDELVPRREITAEVARWLRVLGKGFVAVHARMLSEYVEHARVEWGDNVTAEKDFLPFIDHYPEQNVFLASDNPATQQHFSAIYGDRVKFKPIAPTRYKRQTSVRDAVIDLFTCAEAADFMGTRGSTFSGVIESIRTYSPVCLVYGRSEPGCSMQAFDGFRL